MSTSIISAAMIETIASCVAAIVVKLDTGEILWATPPCDNMFGYIEGELAGRKLTDLIPERFRLQHDSHLASYSANPTPRAMGQLSMNLFGLHRSGAEFSVEIALYPKVVAGWRCAVATIVKIRI